jgi:hypothetical protein
MLINDSEQFIRVAFDNEAEIEGVVQRYAEQFFGSSIVYLSQARITTVGGRGTVPDAIVIDIESEEWYIVEAERAIHGTWEHIAPQVSRQLAAVSSPETRDVVLHLALSSIRGDSVLRSMIREVGVEDLEIHGRLQRILRKPPTIAIPIDAIPKDLKEWVQTLRNPVKIWLIEKFISVGHPARILYSIPDENLPTLSTEPDSDMGGAPVRSGGAQIYQELLDLVPDIIGSEVTLEYGPRGRERRSFRGIIRADGVEVDGKVYSPSYAAVACMKEAGSTRHTANGWVMWRTPAGETLSELYRRRLALLSANRDADSLSFHAPLSSGEAGVQHNRDLGEQAVV